MAKFKVGDVIVYSKVLHDSIDFCIGDKFEVTEVYDHYRIKIKPLSDDYPRLVFGVFTLEQFELADNKLTPEEVLQYFKDDRQHELEYTQPDGTVLGGMSEYTGVTYLFKGTWRVKPVPKTIDYYGTEIPKPVTKEEAEAEGLKVVYKPLLSRTEYIHLYVAHELRSDGNLYFRTKDDAITVRKVMLKPFE